MRRVALVVLLALVFTGAAQAAHVFDFWWESNEKTSWTNQTKWTRNLQIRDQTGFSFVHSQSQWGDQLDAAVGGWEQPMNEYFRNRKNFTGSQKMLELYGSTNAPGDRYVVNQKITDCDTRTNWTDHVIYLQEEPNPSGTVFASSSPVLDAGGHFLSACIQIRGDLDWSNHLLVELIVKHELGHALGLGHTTVDCVLMADEICAGVYPQAPTAHDKDSLYTVWNSNP